MQFCNEYLSVWTRASGCTSDAVLEPVHSVAHQRSGTRQRVKRPASHSAGMVEVAAVAPAQLCKAHSKLVYGLHKSAVLGIVVEHNESQRALADRGRASPPRLQCLQ